MSHETLSLTNEIEVPPSALGPSLKPTLLRLLRKRERSRVIQSRARSDSGADVYRKCVVTDVRSVDELVDARVTNATCAPAVTVRYTCDVLYVSAGDVIRDATVIVVTIDGVFLDAFDKALQCLVTSGTYSSTTKSVSFAGCECELRKGDSSTIVVESVYVVNGQLYSVCSHACSSAAASTTGDE